MNTRLPVVLCVILWVTAIAAQSASTSRAGIQGVWRIAESTHHGDATNTHPQPSLYLFTGKHYAMLRVTSPTPRIAPVDPDKASAAELLAVWGNNGFVANAGTYEVRGGNLTIRPVVAKNPDAMTRDFFITYAVKFEGDTLVLTEFRDNKAPVPYPTAFTLRRVE